MHACLHTYKHTCIHADRQTDRQTERPGKPNHFRADPSLWRDLQQFSKVSALVDSYSLFKKKLTFWEFLPELVVDVAVLIPTQCTQRSRKCYMCTCMCVDNCVYMYVYMYVYKYILMYVYAHVYTHMYMYISCICICTCICKYICIYFICSWSQSLSPHNAHSTRVPVLYIHRYSATYTYICKYTTKIQHTRSE